MERLTYPQNDFPSGIEHETAHRPWPMPSAPWLMTQSWHDLLFAHWPMAPGELSQRVPPEFELDLFDGQAWIGVVPFHMSNVAPRGVPAMPWVSQFPELNVRTYVRAGGRPGVYFFSLDAANPVAVEAARTLLRLPYHWATMLVERDGEEIHYRSRRGDAASAPQFVASYRPSGPRIPPAPGTIEHFLTERYCLYARDLLGRPYRLQIHHRPWQLQSAVATIERNTMVSATGLTLPDLPPLLHFSKRQDTLTWGPERL